MILKVKVIPNSKEEKIYQENGIYKIKLKKPALEGRANLELIKFLSKEFTIKKGNIKILKGEKTRDKIIEINEL
ncbi:DUF167 domain-containing protein [bacterium]|nr:DUF167 domain-containing protein [bacterium]